MRDPADDSFDADADSVEDLAHDLQLLLRDDRMLVMFVNITQCLFNWALTLAKSRNVDVCEDEPGPDMTAWG